MGTVLEMRRAVIIVILASLLISAFSMAASAETQSVFYLHTNYLLDQNRPAGTTASALRLTGAQYYVWKAAPFSTTQSFPSGTWTATVWMNTTQGTTQYRLGLGIVTANGAFIDHAHSFTPTITTSSPTRYDVSISAGPIDFAAGESLGIGLIRRWQNESLSLAACVFFDSEAIPSGLSGLGAAPITSTTTHTTTAQVTTTTTQHTTTSQTTAQQTTTTQQTTTQQTTTQQTTTQQTTSQQTTTSITQAAITTTGQSGLGIGWALALVGVGLGAAFAGAGVAFAAGGRPYSEVFAYRGYYYCKKHRVPLWNVQGWLWCPVERRYLRP